MIHVFPSGFQVEMVGADETADYDATNYGIYLRDALGEEIVSWTGQEWIEDPSVVASIVNAICIHGAGIRED